MKKILSLLLLLCIGTTVAKAQTAASYAFSTPTPSYTPLTGATTVPAILGDDITQQNIPIGFTFVFCGTNCTTVSACSNGWLSLANSSPSAAVGRTNTAANVATTGAILMPFWDDLWGTSGTSTASYKTTGTAPNRVFTFEWKSWQQYSETYFFFSLLAVGGANNVSMQVKLYETSNIIEFCYGSGPTLTTGGSTFIGTVTATNGTIGIANSTTDYQTLNGATATPTSSSASFTTSIGNAPPANTIYRWSPACNLTVAASNNGPLCSGSTLSLTGTILTGTATTFSWTGPAGYTSALQNPSITNVPTSRAGTYSFTATSSSCSISGTTNVVVDTTPVASVSGTTSICSGNSATITFTGTAGATVSYNINGGSTLITVLSALGTSTVNSGTLTTGGTATNTTYNILSASLGSCSRSLTGSAIVTVNPLPAAISGPSAVCEGGFNITLSSSPAGTWSSGSGGVAAINSGTGVITSGTSGVAVITYTLPVTNCYVTTPITVNPTPPAITGTLQVCQSGGTTALSNTMPSGTWSVTPASLAIIGATSGLATGILPGSATVTYTVGGSCYTTATLTVNPTLSAIIGPGTVCEAASISLSHLVTGGTWSATPASAGSIDPVTGVVTAGTAGTLTVTYLAPTNCSVTRDILVNPGPPAITGTPTVCKDFTTTLYNAGGAGFWTSSNTLVATVDAGGVVTGVNPGTSIISYTSGTTACKTSIPAIVYANPLPITGPTTTVCGGGAVITLSDLTPLGDWSSSASSTASADPTTGAITGGTAGTATITYAVTATGCYTTTNVTVIPTPAPITGPTGVCESGPGSTITLADATVPGTWSIASAGTASISTAGVVTGISAGSATVTYTRSNNCFVTYPVTINPLPAPITGTMTVCQLSVTTLSSLSSGGFWTTGGPFVASVGLTGGDVHGLLGGTAPITYTLPTGCLTTAAVTVNPIPAAIGGANYVCHGYTSVVTNTVAGGTWSMTPLSVATIDASGTMYGVTVGAANVTYTTGTNGCYTTKPISVNPIVAAGISIGVSPSNTVCAGTTVTFTANPVNGGSAPLFVWSVNGVILSGASAHTYVPADGDIIRCWYISSYDCAQPDTASDVVVMTVHPIVTPAISLATAGGDTVCVGSSANLTATIVGGGTAPTYAWYVNFNPMGAGPALSYIPNNGDVVTCTISSNAFCRTANTASATKILTVSPYITPVVSMSSSMGMTTCEGYPVVFNATGTNTGTAPTYQWAVNGSNTGTGTFYSYPPANADSVTVTLTSNFPCLTTPSASANINMTVIPITQPVGTVTAKPGYIIPAGMADTFTCTILSGGGSSPLYQWFKNNVPQAGETNDVYITNSLISGDSVSCQVTNLDQCSGVATFTSLSIIVGSNVGVGHVAQINSSFQLVPNPNNGSFVVRGSLSDNATEELLMEVTDVLGRTIYGRTAKVVNGNMEEQIKLDNALSAGMYLLTIKSKTVNAALHFVVEQ